MTPDELIYQINPLVPTSIQHNTKVLSQLRNLTSSLFGVAAGILGLEAWMGFLFYVVGTMMVSGMVWALLAGGRPGMFFPGGSSGVVTVTVTGEKEAEAEPGSGWRLWTEDVVGGLSSFVLTWTLFYGLVRA